MRRMVRDYYHCNFSAMQTLSVWEKVLRREDVLMRPHRLLADVHIDTTHSYEPFLYHDAIARLLGEAGDCGIFQPLAERILAAQGHFFQIPRELIPGTSLIQAFLH